MTAASDADFVGYVATCRPDLRRVAYLLCGDWHLAEDLVQIALSKLYLAWPRVRLDDNVDGYTRQILVRCHLDEVKRPWRRVWVTDVVPEPVPVEPPSVEDRDAIRAIVDTLPTGQRTAVVLRYWLGMSVQETAAAMGCSSGTVKSHTARAVVKMRALLVPVGATEGGRHG